MGSLQPRDLERLITSKCTSCNATKLVFRTYVDARLPIAGGEPNGPITWAYKGELFLDGVFEVSCAECRAVIFHDDHCPRCHRENALQEILSTHNRLAVPKTCPGCGIADLRMVAMVPARVVYAAARADKARTQTELYDPGFHALKIDCASCGPITSVVHRCPLCDAEGPIRPRPT